MLDSMFGLEFSLPMKFFIAFAIVLILIGAAAYLLRRFGTGTLAVNTQRNRQPRLAVVDATAIDNRRKLVIVRRDNVEHLLLIGGPTDVLVEPNIMRGSVVVQPARDTSPIRTTAAEQLAPLPEGGWSAPPESRPEPVVRPAQQIPVTQAPFAPQHPPERAMPPIPPAPTLAPMPAAPRAAPPAPPPAPRPVVVEPAMPAPEVRAPQPAPAPRPVVTAAAAPLPPPVAPQAVAPTPPAEVIQITTATVEVVPEAIASPETAAAPPAREEQNLADMANRLEAALRRPVTATPQPAPPRPAAPAAAPRAQQPVPPPPAAAQRGPAGPAPSYENLQREMASLLGRQPGGS